VILAMVIVLYLVGWIAFIVVHQPEDAAEGALMIFCGILWPIFALGWITSLPFRYR
jgi:hypothetical protein